MSALTEDKIGIVVSPARIELRDRIAARHLRILKMKSGDLVKENQKKLNGFQGFDGELTRLWNSIDADINAKIQSQVVEKKLALQRLVMSRRIAYWTDDNRQDWYDEEASIGQTTETVGDVEGDQTGAEAELASEPVLTSWRADPWQELEAQVRITNDEAKETQMEEGTTRVRNNQLRHSIEASLEKGTFKAWNWGYLSDPE